MIAGELTENIAIYRPHIIRNEFNEQVNEYIFMNHTKAKKLNLNGMRNIENNEIVYIYNKKFEVRYYVDVDEFDRIKYDGKFYRILNIDRNRNEQKITIECELVNE